MALINGEVYSASNITIAVNGQRLYGVTEINYDDSDEMSDVYTFSSRKPTGRSYGNITFSGSIKVLMADALALTNAAPNGRLQELICTITVAYTKGTTTIRDVIEQVQFKTNGRSASVGGDAVEVELEMMIGDIRFNV